MSPFIYDKYKKGVVNISSNSVWKDFQCIFYTEDKYEQNKMCMVEK